jgi:hypothetical protein
MQQDHAACLLKKIDYPISSHQNAFPPKNAKYISTNDQ